MLDVIPPLRFYSIFLKRVYGKEKSLNKVVYANYDFAIGNHSKSSMQNAALAKVDIFIFIIVRKQTNKKSKKSDSYLLITI